MCFFLGAAERFQFIMEKKEAKKWRKKIEILSQDKGA